MPIMHAERNAKSQIGYCNNSSTGYAEAGGDLSFATGIVFLARMKVWLPRGATINSANLSMQVIAKNAGTAQTSFNSFRAHYSGDSPTLIPGALEAQRPWTTARVVWNCVWPVNPTGDVIANINVKPIIDEIMARSDYQPGGFITLMMYVDNENGSDMSVRANNDFAQTWQLRVDFTENYVSDTRTLINLMNNPVQEALPSSAFGTDPVPFWGQNPFFGAFVDAANFGTLALDNSFTRVAGVPTMRFTCAAPPAANDKSTGPFSTTIKQNEYPYIFCGWTYIPAAVTSQVYFGDPYIGKSHLVTARDQWVPFCSTPSDLGSGQGAFWPAVQIRAPFQAGWQVWVSEPTVLISSFKQMPFNGGTPDLKDPGLSTLVDNKRVGSGQGAVKEWLPRTGVIRSGTLRRVPRYIKRADGILQVAEPVKGGPLVPLLPPVAIQDYPAGKTVAEL